MPLRIEIFHLHHQLEDAKLAKKSHIRDAKYPGGRISGMLNYHLPYLRIFVPHLLRQFLHHFRIAMTNQWFYEIIRQRPSETNLIPIFLIPMPCRLNFGMMIPKINTILRISFQHKIIRALHSNASENLSAHSKKKIFLSKCHILRCQRQRKTIFSYRLYIHNANLPIFFEYTRKFPNLFQFFRIQSKIPEFISIFSSTVEKIGIILKI